MLAAATFAVAAAFAHAGDASCAAPAVTAFIPPPSGARVGVAREIGVETRDAVSVEMTFGDGGRGVASVRHGSAFVRHAYARPGARVVSAVAVSACGARSLVGRLRLQVAPPCSVARDGTLDRADCDDARGSLLLSARGLIERATWISAPCRDVLPPLVHVPPAKAAQCTFPSVWGVDGRLPIRPGGALLLRLGAPAERVTVWTGDRTRRTRRLGRARPISRSDRVWRFRLPHFLGSPPRVYVRAGRRFGSEEWVAGIRVAG